MTSPLRDDRLAEIRETPSRLDRIADLLEPVDWPGGSWGQSAITDAAEEFRELLAEVDRLRAVEQRLYVDPRPFAGCGHSITEACEKCVCPTCRTPAVELKELGWIPVSALAAAQTPAGHRVLGAQRAEIAGDEHA